MRLGYLTDFSEEEAKFARRVGFDSLEISCNNKDANFWKVISKKGGVESIKEKMEENDLAISALGFYFNQIQPEDWQKQRFLKLLEIAPKLKVKVICTFAGRDPEKSPEDNIPLFKKAFTPLVKRAEDNGIKIAIENCPMMCGHPFRGINIAFAPKVWDLMFEAVDSKNFGLEFDPSHLHWLGIDYIQTAKDYRDKVYHVHAKDTEILEERLAKESIYGTGWWRYRLPGLGEIDWKGFISTLYDIGYKGNIAIEHEDPVFAGKRRNEGLRLGYKHLSLWILKGNKV
ncbi:MAG: sugar phosphate isomerase/epimerase [Candidatus Omnitrophica bacterium]|nr:sugar phosphate isomerase/epimerase [Candidatus Omnitrophota bacterium]